MASLRPPARAAAALTSVVLLLGYAVATASPSSGASPPHTYRVNSTKDTVDADVGVGACADSHKKCSLRAAIMQANFHPGPDTIKVPAGTYTLTRKGDDDQDVLGDLDVTDSVTIEGAGPSKTIIDGNGTVTGDRTVEVFPTAVDTTITGLRIRGGRRMETFGTGGGLLWEGSGSGKFVARHVTFSGNQAYDGGGLAVQYGSTGDAVTLDHVTAEHNTATAAVGAIEVSLGSFGTFLMRHSVVRANKAYEGAGLYVQGPTSVDDATSATVESTVFSHNHASGLSGALEYHGGASTSLLTVTTSYFHDNIADIQGGAIGQFFGDLAVTRSTLEGNTAVKGGAVYDYDAGVATFTNTTFSRNTASDTGGGVYVEFVSSGLAHVVLRQSTLDRNSAPTGGGIYVSTGSSGVFANTMVAHGSKGANCFGNSGGLTSLSDDSSCGFGGGDNVDLKLGPIGPHGGTTRTLVPRPGSPAWTREPSPARP